MERDRYLHGSFVLTLGLEDVLSTSVVPLMAGLGVCSNFRRFGEDTDHCECFSPVIPNVGEDFTVLDISIFCTNMGDGVFKLLLVL